MTRAREYPHTKHQNSNKNRNSDEQSFTKRSDKDGNRKKKHKKTNFF